MRPASYPVDDIIPELREVFRNCTAAVLSAPPGAGKTTRVPLALLDIIPPDEGRIIMLEPRRIAAVSAARWMARSLGEEVGGTVGYAIRFERRVSQKTRVEVVTEGILTRRIQTDPSLDGTAMVIFDEFHERSIQADLALALCLDLKKVLRPDMKLLVMSATLDCGAISSLLVGAPAITAAGQTHPVAEHYLPDRRGPLSERVTAAVVRALKETSGDILVFLPGFGEIRACAEALRPVLEKRAGITLHPLYGNLPFQEQERAILPSENRRIVLATNIAETSITIEGVTVVIDSGLTRRLQYDPSTGMNSLVTVTASRASADQRRGRAGRLSSGKCYRLYSAGAYRAMQPFSPPEIMVSDLSGLALELAAWGSRDPSALSWLDAPPRAAWESALDLLRTLGALGANSAPTELGKKMALLPLHPRLSRLMIKAEATGVRGLGADLAALLSERDIVRRGPAVESTNGPEPDIAGRLALLQSWRRHGEPPQGADVQALRAVDKTSQQLRRLAGGKASGEQPHDADVLSGLLLCAFPDRVAKRRHGGEGRFLLRTGRGVRLARSGGLGLSPFILALHLDAGTGSEGIVHMAVPLTEALIRQECGSGITLIRKVAWDQRQGRIVATQEERLDAIVLGDRPFTPSEEESLPLLCDTIRTGEVKLTFGKDIRRFQGRVSLMKRYFPEEDWPDLSDDRLISIPEHWLLPWLSGMRTARQLAGLDILPAMKALLSREQRRLLDRRAPAALSVPSGREVILDYTAGDIPVLAVKLQEMFGLADTPLIADGRVKVLIHLLSPAMRPVQVTQDLKGFWDSGYLQVRKELKGRYPRHPWPDDPWNAMPTGRTKKKTPAR